MTLLNVAAEGLISMGNQMVTKENSEIILLAFCQNSNNFPRLILPVYHLITFQYHG